jgi:hypothetical protein
MGAQLKLKFNQFCSRSCLKIVWLHLDMLEQHYFPFNQVSPRPFFTCRTHQPHHESFSLLIATIAFIFFFLFACKQSLDWCVLALSPLLDGLREGIDRVL